MGATALVRIRRLASTGAARAIRQDAGLSLGEMAQDVGVHRSTLFRWEAGLRRPRGPAAERYLALLEDLIR